MKWIICNVCNGDGYTSEHDPSDPHEGGVCNHCPIQVQCEKCEATGKILSDESSAPSPLQEAVEFAEWLADNYTKVDSVELGKSAWVNYKEETVLVNGSDYHFTTLINEVGKTTSELFNLFLQSKNKPKC